jgi:hypothetical protein
MIGVFFMFISAIKAESWLKYMMRHINGRKKKAAASTDYV